jgi:adenylate kinase family enzyme
MSAVVDVKHVVVLECAVGNVYGRIAGNSGGDRTDRNDDSIEMIRKKLEIFRSHTAPLIDYYERKGIHAIRVRVDAASSPLDVYSEVSARFPA